MRLTYQLVGESMQQHGNDTMITAGRLLNDFGFAKVIQPYSCRTREGVDVTGIRIDSPEFVVENGNLTVVVHARVWEIKSNSSGYNGACGILPLLSEGWEDLSLPYLDYRSDQSTQSPRDWQELDARLNSHKTSAVLLHSTRRTTIINRWLASISDDGTSVDKVSKAIMRLVVGIQLDDYKVIEYKTTKTVRDAYQSFDEWSHSCMTEARQEGFTDIWGTNPRQVRLVHIKKDEEDICRCLVFKPSATVDVNGSFDQIDMDEKIGPGWSYGRVYGKAVEGQAILEALGLVCSESNNVSGFCLLKATEYSPYIDRGSLAWDNNERAVLFFKVEKPHGFYFVENTPDGTGFGADAPDSTYCSDCNDACDPDDLRYIEGCGEICSCCIDSLVDNNELVYTQDDGYHRTSNAIRVRSHQFEDIDDLWFSSSSSVYHWEGSRRHRIDVTRVEIEGEDCYVPCDEIVLDAVTGDEKWSNDDELVEVGCKISFKQPLTHGPALAALDRMDGPGQTTEDTWTVLIDGEEVKAAIDWPIHGVGSFHREIERIELSKATDGQHYYITLVGDNNKMYHVYFENGACVIVETVSEVIAKACMAYNSHHSLWSGYAAGDSYRPMLLRIASDELMATINPTIQASVVISSLAAYWCKDRGHVWHSEWRNTDKLASKYLVSCDSSASATIAQALIGNHPANCIDKAGFKDPGNFGVISGFAHMPSLDGISPILLLKNGNTIIRSIMLPDGTMLAPNQFFCDVPSHVSHNNTTVAPSIPWNYINAIFSLFHARGVMAASDPTAAMHALRDAEISWNNVVTQ